MHYAFHGRYRSPKLRSDTPQNRSVLVFSSIGTGNGSRYPIGEVLRLSMKKILHILFVADQQEMRYINNIEIISNWIFCGLGWSGKTNRNKQVAIYLRRSAFMTSETPKRPSDSVFKIVSETRYMASLRNRIS